MFDFPLSIGRQIGERGEHDEDVYPTDLHPIIVSFYQGCFGLKLFLLMKTKSLRGHFHKVGVRDPKTSIFANQPYPDEE